MDDAHDFQRLLEPRGEEPLYISRSVQPFGVLIACDMHADNIVSYISANAAELIQREPKACLGAELTELLPELSHVDFDQSIVEMELNIGQKCWSLTVFLSESGQRVLEFLSIDKSSNQPLLATLRFEVLSAISSAKNEIQLIEYLCDKVKDLTGFDKALGYRFDDDFNGHVIAESLSERLPETFLGHHFPASDMARETRQMFVEKRVRAIPDIGCVAVPILSFDGAAGNIDLSQSELQSISPFHIPYCQNMESGAALSVAFTVDDQLWALLGLHHATAKRVPQNILGFLKELSLSVSIKLNELNRGRHDRMFIDLLSCRAEIDVQVQSLSEIHDKNTSMASFLCYACDLLGADAAFARVEGKKFTHQISENVADEVFGQVTVLEGKVCILDSINILANDSITGQSKELCDVATYQDTAADIVLMMLKKERPQSKTWTDLDKKIIPTLGTATRRICQETDLRALTQRSVDLAARYEMIFSSAGEALVIVNGDGQIIEANPASESLFGWDKGSLIGEQIEKLVPAAVRHNHPGWVKTFVESKKEKKREMASGRVVSAVRQNGEAFPVQITLSISNSAPNNPIAIAVIRDHTEIQARQVELSRLIAETERLALAEKEANAAKDRFIGTVSHELRTPLNAIIGFSEFMQSEPYGPLVAKYREFVSDIKLSGMQLLGLVNNLIDLSRLRSGLFAVEIEKVNLRDAIIDAVRLIRPLRIQRGQILRAKNINRSIFVQGDKQAITQVIINLLSNSTKYTPPGTRINIEIKENDYIELSITDNGPGYPIELLPVLGEPFEKGIDPYVHTSDSSGLGLAISKALIDRMDGQITFNNRDVGGACMTVKLCRSDI